MHLSLIFRPAKSQSAFNSRIKTALAQSWPGRPNDYRWLTGLAAMNGARPDGVVAHLARLWALWRTKPRIDHSTVGGTEPSQLLVKLTQHPYRTRVLGEMMRIGDYILLDNGVVEAVNGWRDTVFNEDRIKQGAAAIYTTEQLT